jgi:hypothetical protein
MNETVMQIRQFSHHNLQFSGKTTIQNIFNVRVKSSHTRRSVGEQAVPSFSKDQVPSLILCIQRHSDPSEHQKLFAH